MEYPLWMDADAVLPCRQPNIDPDIFFAVGKALRMEIDTRKARKLCSGCEFQRACAEWATDNWEADGVWGGMTRHQRRVVNMAIPDRERENARYARTP